MIPFEVLFYHEIKLITVPYAKISAIIKAWLRGFRG